MRIPQSSAGIPICRIRFSSFGNGFKSGMGCFCQTCCAFYSNEGVNTYTFKQLMNSDHKDFLVPHDRHGMHYSFKNALIDNLLLARAKLITVSVKKIARLFRQRGLEIGLDVFAPPFACLFGQDIGALADYADFIKPMMYRVTNAPAGIPYESEQMKTQLRNNGCDINNRLEILWETKNLANEDCFATQLELLKTMPCEIYPGVEVNKVDFCATSTAYVKRTIEAIRESGIAGCVLSWNVLAETVYP